MEYLQILKLINFNAAQLLSTPLSDKSKLIRQHICIGSYAGHTTSKVPKNRK